MEPLGHGQECPDRASTFVQAPTRSGPEARQDGGFGDFDHRNRSRNPPGCPVSEETTQRAGTVTGAVENPRTGSFRTPTEGPGGVLWKTPGRPPQASAGRMKPTD